jgi:hypothetical protein
MSDLVQRLRSWAQMTDGEDSLSRGRVETEAADRIESLERQLAEANAREARDYSGLMDEFNKVKVQNVQLLNRLAEAELVLQDVRALIPQRLGAEHIREKLQAIVRRTAAPSPSPADKTKSSEGGV